MNFAFDAEQQELRQTARDFLRDHSSPEQVRQAMASERGFDPEVWKRIGAELGWTALLVPEEYGGLGLGNVELAALMEVLGEFLYCGPFFSSVVLGTNAFLVAGTGAQREAHLPGIAEGQTLVTLALSEEGGGWDPARIETTCERSGSDFVLRGAKRYVPDGGAADLLVVAAREVGSTGEHGLHLFIVPAEHPGLERRALTTLDQTRRQAALELRDVRVPADARMDGDGSALREILDRACVAVSAEQVGGAQRCLDLTVDYAKERVQFGRAIGSFQAIKHKCAQMMLRVESARSASYYAACVADMQGDGREPLGPTASLAKAYASDAFFYCAAEAMQIHGGVGFTWEYDVHLWFKRARSSETLLGESDFHRERIASSIGLDDQR